MDCEDPLVERNRVSLMPLVSHAHTTRNANSEFLPSHQEEGTAQWSNGLGYVLVTRRLDDES